MSIILPHVMRQYGHSAYKRLADLAGVCGIEGPTTAAKANRFIDWIEEVKKEMSIPAGADMIKDEDVPQIITWAMAEANPLYPCPQVWEKEDFEQLIATIRNAK
jgi:Alcohol dehydrogenase, class IV